MGTLRAASRLFAISLLSLGLGASAETITQIHTLQNGTPTLAGSITPSATGTANTSLLNQTVTTTGIVVAVATNAQYRGFYLEAKQSDWNNPLTTASEGLIAHPSSA